jgi:long-chain fatty acid transport protein
MRNSNRSVKVTTLALGIMTALLCGQAMASGFQIREDSVQAMSRSHAGSASAPGDAAVVSNNPAAMSLFDNATVQSDLTAIDLSFTFAGGGHDALGRPLTGGNGGNAGDISPVPAFSFIKPLGDGFAIGASFTAPFGLKTQYDPNWVGRYQALKSDVRTFDFTVAGSYKFNDMFSVGVSGIFQRFQAELTNAIDFGAILTPAAFPVFQPQSADGTARIQGHDSAFGYDLGVLFRPTPDTNIGLNYRSKINHTVSGHANFNVPSNVRAVLNSLHSTAFTNSAITADVATPSVLTLSITQKLSDTFSLSADIERTNWSSLQKLTVHFANPAQPDSTEQFHWSNTMQYALGMDWKFSPDWVLRAGVARDETPTNNTFRDPRLPDNNRQLYSIGLGWTPNANASWNIGYSRINVDNSSVHNVSATGSTLDGTYSGDANLFGISGTFSFGDAPEPVIAAPPPPPPPPAKTCADMDDDGDGVNNCLDKCPDSPAGQAVGPDGCPVPAPEPVLEPKPFKN